MTKFEARHDDGEDRENAQIVGHNDLRDVFKSETAIKGSFSLNGFEFTNFQAGSPEAVVATINRHTNQTGVTASLNDSGHLVLDNNDPDDITVKLGKPFDEPAPLAGSVADDVVNKLKAESRKQDGTPRNEVLDMLGLDETETPESNVSASDRPDQKPRRDEDTRNIKPQTPGQPAAGHDPTSQQDS